MSWYKDWFNSEHYIRVYSHRDESEALKLVELISKNLDLKENSSVLDMACGAGRHAIVFAKKRFNVTAVDLSYRLISGAIENAKQSGVKIDFILSDILEFSSSKKYDLVVNLFTSIGYFDSDEDNYAVINKAYSLLVNGGYFVLDYFNKDFLLKHLIPFTVFSEDGFRISQNRVIEGNRIVKKIVIENSSTTEEFHESVRLFSYDEIISCINDTGFKLINCYGNYNGNEFSRENTSRLIIFAQK